MVSIMPLGSEYFRKHARTCLALAEATSGTEIARTLRLMASDFMATAAELDKGAGRRPARTVLLEQAPETD